MGCGNMFFTILVTFSVALITYNILISANAPLKQDFPGPSTRLPSISVDPLIKMPLHRSTHSNSNKRLFHTAVTASDSVYNTWQCRVMYYWFKKMRDQGGPESAMGGFTRILHSGKPDQFMDEIPTFVAQPLPAGVDQVQGYIVLNRPGAFVQWLQQADIKEDYILMSEPDHIIVKPIPNLARDGLGAAFPFFYIEPKKYEKVLRKYFPEEKGPITNIDPIGNSPVIVAKESLKKIAPTWMNVSLAMKKDPETDKAFGWVLEMYAYAVSSALHGVGNILHKEFMIQPPWDKKIGNTYIIHYTYGCDYNMKGELTYGKIGEWRFDKRSYDHVAPPKNLTLPPPGVPESVVTLVKMVNEATANIPNWWS
ncbi:hydroxyproline O-arabinosyltransferase 1 isoform X1 [Arachis duranensis]|uniref:Hydroxyproline O-arabinosyltransferase 1 isoform X1 n=1 Tax=Arachis duranensis TaxID=130453 RepID=A0A6P4DTD4_ARADU|nr:hydroxyproline O-arabinosyltransferase 1 isoform X1 [Arachis duranensis]XP_025606536.1 hydroxyproline O-arabinosyltransferase 1 isoform X1 [Arachis hypogaea]